MLIGVSELRLCEAGWCSEAVYEVNEAAFILAATMKSVE